MIPMRPEIPEGKEHNEEHGEHDEPCIALRSARVKRFHWNGLGGSEEYRGRVLLCSSGDHAGFGGDDFF